MTQSFNPYEVTFDETAPTPTQLNYVRNIRAISSLYVFMGLVAVIAGLAMLSSGPRWLGGFFLVSGSLATVSAIGLLLRKRWGVPGCKLVSFLYLVYIPIGTILGIYFLRNVRKVRHLLS
ncbi:MAG: hypothetical protein AB8G99_23480 [Planctomycetaceae bacterium]